MTVHLLQHMQNCDLIWSLFFMQEQHMFLKFWIMSSKTLGEMDPWWQQKPASIKISCYDCRDFHFRGKTLLHQGLFGYIDITFQIDM